MVIHKEFELSLEQYDGLKNKIYAVFQENLVCVYAKVFSPDIELDLHDPDELFLDGLMLECADAIELPNELIYQNTSICKYFDYDKNDILTIAKFADILITIFVKYQRQLQKFQDLPKDKQEKYYHAIYQVIQSHILIQNNSFSPDIIINSEQVTLSKRQSKKMVEQSAIVMGLNKHDIYRYFRDQNFFKFPDYLKLLKILSDFISFIADLIFYTIIWIITGKWQIQIFPHQKLDPITARQFADILIRLRLMENV